MTEFVTFFSYKGGVGRTSALMNVARHLAARKKKVLVVDLDLPAPGVDIFEIVDQMDADYPSYNKFRKTLYRAFQSRIDEIERKNEKIAEELRDILSLKGVAAGDQHTGRYPLPVKWLDLENILLGKKSNISGMSEFMENIKNEIFGRTESNDSGVSLGFLEFAYSLLLRRQDLETDTLPVEKLRAFLDRVVRCVTGKSLDEFTVHDAVYTISPKSITEAEIKVLRCGLYEAALQELVKEKISKCDQSNMSESGDRSYYSYEDLNSLFGSYLSSLGKYRLKELAADIREELSKTGADYVLIDSKPGIDIISKFASYYLADINVFLFNLNPWNFTGVLRAYDELREFRLEQQKKKEEGIEKEISDLSDGAESSESAMERGGGLENFRVLIAASPMPRYAENSVLYGRQLKIVAESMKEARNIPDRGKEIVRVPFSDVLLLRDVLVFDFDEKDLANVEYRKLSDYLIDESFSDVENKISRVLSARDDVIAKIERLKILEAMHLDSPSPLIKIADLQRERGGVNNFKDAISSLKEAAERDGQPLVPLRNADGGEDKGKQAWRTGFFAEIRIQLAKVCDSWLRELLEKQREKDNAKMALLHSSSEGKDYQAIIEEAVMASCRLLREIWVSREHGGKGADEEGKVASVCTFLNYLDTLENSLSGIVAPDHKPSESTEPFKRGEAELLHAVGLLLNVLAHRALHEMRSAEGDQATCAKRAVNLSGWAYEFSKTAFHLDKGNSEYVKSLNRIYRTYQQAIADWNLVKGPA